MDGVCGDRLPFATFYLAVIFAVRFSSIGPAIFVLVASLLLGDFFFSSPRHTFAFTSTGEWLEALVFVLVSSGLLVYGKRERAISQRERKLQVALEDKANQSLLETAQRKVAEEALRASEDKFRRIFETANEGIWIVDEHGFISLINSRMAEMLGYTPDELVGHNKDELVPSEDLEHTHALFKRRSEGFTDQVDVRFRHKQGHTLWALMCARPIWNSDNKFSGALDMFTDITERKRAEIRLDLLADTASQLLRSHEPQYVVDALCQKVMAILDCQVFFNFLV
ncbi:MAG: PAS domain S-box protein, partial [Acidobacteriota bacterium]